MLRQGYFLVCCLNFYQLFFGLHRKKPPGLSEQNGKGGLKSERKRVPKSALQPGEGTTEERERKERRETRRLEKGRSQEYPDRPEKREDGRVAEEEKQRKEEEYQTRYRSDPNLARYPVKPPPEEQQMRMHARVSRARHERRHSDVALPHTEAAAAPAEATAAGKRAPAATRASPPESPRARAPAAQPPAEHGPLAPRPVPGPAEPPEPRVPEPLRKQGRLDPGSAVLLRKAKREKAESMLRNDSLSSDQSESVRPSPPKPHRPKRGGKRRQMSVSSSEEEGVSTPEYTSCEDVELESESVSEKGERGSEVKMRADACGRRCWAGVPLCQAHLRLRDAQGCRPPPRRCCAPRSLCTGRTCASIPLQMSL